MPEFAGLKVTQDADAAARHGLQLVTLRKDRHEILTAQPGVLGYFGNSGTQALNLVVQLGAARVILVGFDMGAGPAPDAVHWHGRHAVRLNNPSAERLAEWAERLDAQAFRLAELGVEVLNASPASALKAFPKLSLQEALAA